MHKKPKAPISKPKHQQQPSSLQQVLFAYGRPRNKSAGTKYSKNNKMSHSNPKARRKIQGNSKIIKQVSQSKPICDRSEVDVNKKKVEQMKTDQSQNQKRSLQMKYLRVVEECYSKFTNLPSQRNTKREASYEENLRTTIPETALYFLGSVVQRIKKQNFQISYLEFIDQCIKVFQRSSYVDIREFLDLSEQINRQPLKSNNYTKIEEIPSIVMLQKQESTKRRIRKNSMIKMEEQEKSHKQVQEQQEKNQQAAEIKIVQPITRTPKKVKFQDEIEQEIEKKPTNTIHNQPEQYLRNLPIIASVESKVVEQTPNICETLKSEVSSPIRKIDKKEQKSVSIDCCKINGENNSILVQTNTILSKINSNIDRLSKTLQFPSVSPKAPYQSNSPLNIQNSYKIEHLHQKYGRINRNKNQQQSNKENTITTTHLFDITKYQSNINYEKIRGYSMNVERNRVPLGDDDRIDRLTAKVEEYINKNTTRIENNIRNVSQLRKCQ